MGEPQAKRRKLLSPGCRVQVKGLSTETGKKLNGQYAYVIDEDASGRWTVDLDGGARKALKAENLVLARRLRPGVRVEVHGLKSGIGMALNGKHGVVVQERDPTTMRYQVEVEDSGVRALREGNLTFEESGLHLVAHSISMKGPRPSQEDRHVQVTDLHKVAAALHYSLEHLPRPCAMFAVFDGHLGYSCADYIAKNTHAKIIPRLAREAEAEPQGIKALLREAFSELDEEFLAQQDCPDGSTGIVALIIGTDLFVANVGDSCGLLCGPKGKDVEFVFPDHKPGSAAERKRIAEIGGEVVELGGCVRVAHANFEERTIEYERQQSVAPGESLDPMPIALAVSRSFGDRDFKLSADGEKRVNLVNCDADVDHVMLDPGHHRALVLMSDGISDVMSLDEVGKKVVSLDGQPKAASTALCSDSLARGSQDNVTANVIFFRWAKTGKT